MAEYIEREAALNFEVDSVLLVPSALQPFMDGMAFYAEHIKRLSAADVAPVVRGHWEKYSPTWFRCSLCRIVTNLIAANYGPNCGAKMDMEGE